MPNIPKKSLLSRIGSKLRSLVGARVKPLPPARQIPVGHRGIAAGDLQERFRRMEAGEEPYSPEEVAKWQTVAPTEVEDFLYNGQPLVVHSSNVGTLTYFREENKLLVTFLDDSRYLYSNVSPSEAEQFATAQSKGSLVWTLLRVRGSKTAHRKPFVKL